MSPTMDAMISPARIVDLKGESKQEVLGELLDLVGTSPVVADAAEVRRKLLEREASHSTGIGQGVALPHVKVPQAKDFVIAIGRKTAGVDFEAIDGKPVHIIVMICCHESQAGEFLKVMARFVKVLKEKDFRRNVLLAKSPEDIAALFLAAP